jgi:hypothetical protein
MQNHPASCASQSRPTARERSTPVNGGNTWRTVDIHGPFALPRSWMPGLPEKINRPAASPHAFLKRGVGGEAVADLLRGPWIILPRPCTPS